MSKFSERLSGLGQSAPAQMGFGRSAARPRNPVMLVIGRGGDAKKDADRADLFLGSSGQTSGEGDWGVEVDGGKSPDLEALAKSGCQFIVITSEEASAGVLLSEEIVLGMYVSDGLPEHRVRAIDDGPFEFLVYSPASISWPLTVGSTLLLQDLVSSFSKHIFLELPAGSGQPGEADLEVLKNLPVSALIVDLAKTKPADSVNLKEAIGKMEPRKHSARSDRSPLVPLSGRATADEVDTGDDGYEDEDDDWED